MDSDKKLQLIDLLMHEEDESVLEQVYEILGNRSSDPWDSIGAELKSSIEEGLDDIEEGRVYTHSQVLKMLNER